MTQDDIIRIAREVGFATAWITESGVVQWSQLERRCAEAIRAEGKT